MKTICEALKKASIVPAAAVAVPASLKSLVLEGSLVVELNHKAKLEFSGDDSKATVIVYADDCEVIASARAQVEVINHSQRLKVTGENRAQVSVVSCFGEITLNCKHGSQFEVFALNAEIKGSLNRIATARVHRCGGQVNLEKKDDAFYTVIDEDLPLADPSGSSEANTLASWL